MKSGHEDEIVYGECDKCGAYRDLITVNMVHGKAFLCPDCYSDLGGEGSI
jgi:hypothetical protein